MKSPLTPEYMDAVNEIVPQSTAEGAYCVGMVSVLAWQTEYQPDRGLLESAAACDTIPDALRVFELWLAKRRATARPAAENLAARPVVPEGHKP